MKFSDRCFGFGCCWFGSFFFFSFPLSFPPRWREDLVSTEFLLVWIMLYGAEPGTQLPEDTHATQPLSLRLLFALTCSSDSRRWACWPGWSVLGEGLSFAASKLVNTSAEFWLPGDPPRALKTQASATKAREPRRLQTAIHGQHLHDPKLVRLLVSCSWGRHVLRVNGSACLAGAELTNGGCNISINRGGKKRKK